MMTNTLQIILPIIILLPTYLIGSIPFGLVLTKTFLRQDIRKIGSGNIGATNVLRTGSKILAILTVILDAMKPYFAYHIVKGLMKFIYGKDAMFLFFGINQFNTYITIAIVAITILAHCFPIYLKFKGGKGVATVFGSLFLFSTKVKFLCINWYLLPLAGLATWLLIAIISKKSSLSALLTAVLLPLYVYFLTPRGLTTSTLTIFYVFVSLFVIVRHKSNIKRLLNGEESNIKLSKDKK